MSSTASTSTPDDPATAGSEYRLLVDAHGLPLDVPGPGANRHDSMLVEPILDSMPAIERGLGRHRWLVERTLGWLLSGNRLALRYDRTALTITALARRAVTSTCARRLPTN